MIKTLISPRNGFESQKLKFDTYSIKFKPRAVRMEFTITQPDDWHLHLRDSELLQAVVPHSAKFFKRAIVMPNLKLPVTTTAAAITYQESIMKSLPSGSTFDPLMTLYLTDKTQPDEIKLATFNSTPFTAEIVVEHITTMDAVKFVESCEGLVDATVTPQHLLLNRNALFQGGLQPHNYCLPVLKREIHRQAIVKAVTSGSKKFFLGTDSAPHEWSKKEASCGCAVIYSAPTALSLYAKVFDEAGALDKLEAFTNYNGPDFYGLSRNSSKVTEEISLEGSRSILLHLRRDRPNVSRRNPSMATIDIMLWFVELS